MEKLKQNWKSILIVFTTVIFGGIAIITALKLNQAGKKPVAPTAPLPAPAQETPTTPSLTACTYSFCIPSPTPTSPLTPTPTATITPPITPTPTPIISCYNECSSDSDCRSGLKCQQVEGVGVKRCVNSTCETESDCVCNRHCWDICGHDSECPGDHVCRQIGTSKRCAKPNNCQTEASCCQISAPSPTPTVYKAPVTIPEPGFTLPTIGAIIGGLMLLILGLF